MFPWDMCRAEAWSKRILGFRGIYCGLLTLARVFKAHLCTTANLPRECLRAQGSHLGELLGPRVCAGLTGPEVYD